MIPPVPRNADLRDVRRMPLDVVKLLNTGSWTLATGDEAKAAVTLLAVAWHQVPAGSLPNDERLLAAWSGAGDKWPEVCSMALRGFVECDDGRLYHTVLCDEVERAFHNLEKRRRAATPARKRKQERRVSRIEVA